MPSAKDIKPDDQTSFFLIGRGGTHKTYFIGTCPKPAFVFDLDNGMAILAGQDVDYETYVELDRNTAPQPWQTAQGCWYPWGTAYPKIKAKLSEIGKTMDTGECKYKTIGIDSLTLFYDLLFSYTEKERGSPFKDGRQQWGAVLDIATSFFGQWTKWPVVKVLTAHIKQDENLMQGSIEKLPSIGGQFASKVGILFDEVYYTDQIIDPKGKRLFTAKTIKAGSFAEAKSRKYDLPDGTELDFNKIMEIVRKNKVHAA
jgi:hypothetical protein